MHMSCIREKHRKIKFSLMSGEDLVAIWELNCDGLCTSGAFV